MGRLLYVDLGTGRSWTEPLDPAMARRLIGGSGFGVELLFRHSRFDLDPLAPENPLIFAVGPMAGTKSPLSGRFVAVARSPLTGYYGEAESGNSFATNLKAAGYDALILLGRSERPVYLVIENDDVSIRSAEPYWGMDTFAAGAAIATEVRARSGIALIGQAGENLVPMASIIADVPDARAAARCGMGAVMGSKQLKAVAAFGDRPTVVARPEELAGLLKVAFPVVVAKTKALKDYGSAAGTMGSAVMGDMGARNWTIGDWVEPAEKISGEAMARDILVGRYYCPSCVVGCGRKVKIETGEFAGTVAGGPEYETLAGFGAQMLIDDLRKIAELNDLCNRYGMDTISVSGAIAFALEAAEEGKLALDPDLPAAPLWSNPELVVALVHRIGRRQGVGKLLGQGVKVAAATIGGGTEHYAMHVKGLELAYHDPRALSGLAVGYATHPRGGCHRGCTHYVDRSAFPELGIPEALPRQEDAGKGRAGAALQNYAELYQSLKLCQFEMQALPPSQVLSWYNAITGLDMDLEEFLQAGERVFNLKRLYTLQSGATPAEDCLPPRLMQPYATGGAKDFVPDLAGQLVEYYDERGWNDMGIPTESTLQRLGIPAERGLAQ